MYFAPSEKPLFYASTDTVRPYVTKSFRRLFFNSVHNLSHPGIKATQKLVSARFVSKNINKYCAIWCKNYIQCQISKVTHHTKSFVANFHLPSALFSRVHVDVVGPLNQIRGMTYLLISADRFTRCAEAFPIPDQSADTIAGAFFWDGFPDLEYLKRLLLIVVLIFNEIFFILFQSFQMRIKDSDHCLSPAITSFQESDIFCRIDVQIYLEAAWRTFSNTSVTTPESLFLQTSRRQVRSFRPVPTSYHCSSPVFVRGDRLKASHVFLRIDRILKSLEPPYASPYKVLSKTSKLFIVEFNGRPVTISIERLKAAHMFPDEIASRKFPRIIRVVPRSLMSSLYMEGVHSKLFISRLDCLCD
ncbi:hypothetical protein AVEN_199278-1 [Araneus ventricosus]|uniref:Integrase zinc-binding domain-containing protein n=1 Tax=Araneus ventricosus TaxID=182803 RepID=A0A4Y2LSA1_ARAVE|nr:hypothetical protein AVEN_199278-1 [Araneus ventricosus]